MRADNAILRCFALAPSVRNRTGLRYSLDANADS